jgi:ssDNA-binding Zn-finger/Zn-ribbon topoisomerase 1
MHCLKIMNTPVYKNKPKMPIKDYLCPNFRKMRKGIENKNQRMTIFFLVCLSYIEHRKNIWNPS